MESDFLEFIMAVIIIIVAAKLGGFISTRFNQPSVLGELLAGVLLGPTVLNMLHSWHILFPNPDLLEELLSIMAEIGVILLMLLAGLELHLPDLLNAGKTSALAGILGVLLPLGLGYGAAVLFNANGEQALFLGLTLAATSVSISAQTLMELNVLRSRVGLTLLGAAVFDDILVILVLSIAFVLVGDSAGGLSGVLLTVLSMVLYIGVATAIGIWVLPWLAQKIDQLPISKGTLAFVLVISLLFAYAAEVIGGMAAITGAFLAGLFLGRTSVKEEIEEGISAIAYAFFVPIFFVNIGLEVNLRAISGSAWWFTAVFTLIAIVSKIGGSGLGAKIGGFTNREAFQLGIGMVSRGEVGLIVAAFALDMALITPEHFSIAVFMVIIATLVTPPMLRAAFCQPRESGTIKKKNPAYPEFIAHKHKFVPEECMYHMIMLILDDVNQCSTILEAWESQGVSGITILESTGLGRVRKLSIRDDMPLMPSLSRLLQNREERHRTLFSVVEGEEMVDKVIQATEEVLGDLEKAHNGVLFVLPVSRVVGLQGAQQRAQSGDFSG